MDWFPRILFPASDMKNSQVKTESHADLGPGTKLLPTQPESKSLPAQPGLYHGLDSQTAWGPGVGGAWAPQYGPNYGALY